MEEKKRRGRPRKHFFEDVEELPVEEEEAAEIDVEGEKKITADGELLDGREYKLKTFTLPSREANRLYMISMDVARILGLRDSYMLFSRHNHIARIVATDEDKDHMIELGLLSTTNKNRILPLVTARSVFRAFGHKIIKLGRPIKDDYWVENMPEVEEPVVAYRPIENFDFLLNTSRFSHFATFINDYLITAPPREQNLFKACFSASEFNSKLVAKRPCYHYDAHTNIEQYPRKTQIEQFHIEMKPLNSHALVDDEIVVEKPGFGLGISRDEDWSTIQGTGEMGLYPLALQNGHRTHTLSIHCNRFNEKDAERLAKYQVRMRPLEFEPEPIEIEVEAESDDSGMSVFVCGVLNKSGKGHCKRIVSNEGDRCPHHQVTQNYNSNQKTLCCHCESDTVPSEMQGDMPSNVLLSCSKCHLQHHPACVELDNRVLVAKIQTYNWCCPNCKLCSVCDKAGEESKLLFCDMCDKAYHTYCLDPALYALPEGKWACEDCAHCISCAKTGSSIKWKHALSTPIEPNQIPLYVCTYCSQCYRDYRDDRFCPMCFKTYQEDSDEEMVCCDKCDRWVHYQCDPQLDRQMYDKLTMDQQAVYSCPICEDRVKMMIKKQPHRQFNNVLLGGKPVVVPALF